MTVGTLAPNENDLYKIVHIVRQLAEGRSNVSAVDATALLNVFAGDNGSGGVKGLVPAPAAGDAAKFLRGDASWKGLVLKIVRFTSSGTYTPSPGLVFAIIEGVGTGGGGGGATGAAGGSFSGSGGGGGGYSRKLVAATDIGASRPVTIGAGGAGGSAGSHAGSAGGDTSVGSLLVAKGGAGGDYADNGHAPGPSAGGDPGTGDLTAAGCPSDAPFYSNAGMFSFGMSSGGSSAFGGGAVGPAPIIGASGGSNGRNYGGGGAGGTAAYAAANAGGGNGANGFVVITEFCIQ
jgi:hypothetical protein